MHVEANTPKEYVKKLPDDRKSVINKLRKIICSNLPNGYHCNPKLPLPFMSIASHKNFIAINHMGMYANPQIKNWFTDGYVKHYHTKLSMGKSCIRFKKSDEIPFGLIAELSKKLTVKEWIEIYEETIKRK